MSTVSSSRAASTRSDGTGPGAAPQLAAVRWIALAAVVTWGVCTLLGEVLGPCGGPGSDGRAQQRSALDPDTISHLRQHKDLLPELRDAVAGAAAIEVPKLAGSAGSSWCSASAP